MIAIVVGAFLLGWLIHSQGPDTARITRWADVYVLRFALPVLVFSKISRIALDGALVEPIAIAWAVMTTSAVVILVLSRLLHWDPKITGALLLVGVLGNTSFLGLGLVEGLLGADHVSSAVAYDQLGTFLALSVYGAFVASRYGAGSFGFKPIVRRLIRFVPFIALILSFPAQFIELPEGLYDMFSIIGRTVGPVAMGSLGLRFTLRARRAVLGPAVSALMVKMLLAPIVLIFVAVLTGHMDNMAWESSIMQSAMPPMVTAGVVAVGAGLDEDVVSFMVGVGTLCAFISVPIVSFLL